jgi:hypothetical protein
MFYTAKLERACAANEQEPVIVDPGRCENSHTGRQVTTKINMTKGTKQCDGNHTSACVFFGPLQEVKNPSGNHVPGYQQQGQFLPGLQGEIMRCGGA